MGKIESGAFSSISGKVGNLAGSTWKNINYLKAKQSAGGEASPTGYIQPSNPPKELIEPA